MRRAPHDRRAFFSSSSADAWSRTYLLQALKRQIDRTARRLLRFFHKRVKYDQPPSSRRCLNRPTDSISSGQAHLPQLLAQGSHVRQPNTLRPETLQQCSEILRKASLHVLRKESSSASTRSF